MRERFKQYVKNSQKIESKSEGKYQKVEEKEKNTPRPLTDLESVRTRDVSLPNSIIINDKNTSRILDNLDDLIKLVKNKDPNAEEFTVGLQKAFGLDGNSAYTYKNHKGERYTLRISNHHASPELAKRNGYTKNNTSITIILERSNRKIKDSKFQPSKDVEYLELLYDGKNLKVNKMIGIIKGTKSWVKNVKFTDKGYDDMYVSPYGTDEKFQLAGDINSPAFKKRFGDSKKSDENPINTYRKRSRGQVQSASLSEVVL